MRGTCTAARGTRDTLSFFVRGQIRNGEKAGSQRRLLAGSGGDCNLLLLPNYPTLSDSNLPGGHACDCFLSCPRPNPDALAKAECCRTSLDRPRRNRLRRSSYWTRSCD